MKKSIENLDPKKASQKSDMNTNIIRKNVAFFAKYTRDDINASKRSSKLHNELEEADIVPVHKKSQKYLKKIIDLLVLFQISPKFMKDAYMMLIFPKCQCGFRNGYSAQYGLLVMIEKWEKNCR